MSGPGGPDVYTLPGGQPVMAFAAWQGTTIGYLVCGFRPMYLAQLTFSGGAPSLGPALAAAAGGQPDLSHSASAVTRLLAGGL